MRSVEDVRRRWLDLALKMLTRPGMWTNHAPAFDVMARGLLEDLCFLDEREMDLEAVHAVLHGYGKLGVAGPFLALFGAHNCVAEVASVFAEQFHRLGYLRVDHLADNRWLSDSRTLHDRFDGQDVRRSEVVAECGAPSLIVDGRVLCYAPADGSGWVFVDCFVQHAQEYVPGTGSYEARLDDDPLVRTVRRPADDFESGLILTLYGNVLRWGPGWWIDHPAHLSQEQQAIAAQLRAIRSADPSQALDPRGGRKAPL